MKRIFRRFGLIFPVLLGAFFSMAVSRADDASVSGQAAQFFIAQVKNEVYIVHQGKQHVPNPPEALAENDWVRTGVNSKAYLEFQNGGVVEVGPGSEVKVSQLDITPQDFKARCLLAVGEFKAKVTKLTTRSYTSWGRGWKPGGVKSRGSQGERHFWGGLRQDPK